MATWLGILDERIKAVDVMCYSDLFGIFAANANFCGSQILPGLYQLCDVPDLQGLIAPKPLLVEIGTEDNCFRIEGAMECFKQTEAIYRAAGLLDRLELDINPIGHAFAGKKIYDFFRKYLVG